MDEMPIQEANQPIPLGEMEVEFEIDGRMVRAHAKALERLIPSPDLVLEVSNVPREPRPLDGSPYEATTPSVRSFPITSEGPSTVQLENGRQVPIVPTSWSLFQDYGVLHLQEIPTVVLDAGNLIASMRFSLLNFTSARCPLILQAQPWSVSIEPVSNLQELEKSLSADRGYAITHQGVISRTDQQAYSVQDAKDLLDGLDHFLSFVQGSPCSSTNVSGIDSEGNEAWKRWGARHVSPWRTHRSWFDITASNALSEIFPVFWQEFKDHKVHLSRILELYADSNVTGSCDIAIILTQVALECLTYMTVGKKSRRTTGCWIAAVLQKAGIATQIPADFAKLEEIREREKWEHGPRTIVELRNSMIHAESFSGDISIDAYYEAMRLGLWYLELLLLKKFKYKGKYASRLTPVQRAGNTELVPWAQRGGA